MKITERTIKSRYIIEVQNGCLDFIPRFAIFVRKRELWRGMGWKKISRVLYCLGVRVNPSSVDVLTRGPATTWITAVIQHEARMVLSSWGSWEFSYLLHLGVPDGEDLLMVRISWWWGSADGEDLLMVRICCAITESTSMSMRLNSSSSTMHQDCASPEKNLPIIWSVCVCVCVCVSHWYTYLLITAVFFPPTPHSSFPLPSPLHTEYTSNRALDLSQTPL